MSANMAAMPVRALLLDFYGTLAEATAWGPTFDDVLADLGITLPPEVRDRWWNDGIDGTEHDEHSQSRDHYVAWQRSRMVGLMRECGVPEHHHDPLIERLDAAGSQRRLDAYPEVVEVLGELRSRGITLAVCSNWDWDLAEAVEEAGLTEHLDVLISSAWVGARKPHPRIYRHTLDCLEADPATCLFVGDTWGPDVEGPLAAGMRSVYVRRAGREHDRTAPEMPDGAGSPVATLHDLRGLLELPELC